MFSFFYSFYSIIQLSVIQVSGSIMRLPLDFCVSNFGLRIPYFRPFPYPFSGGAYDAGHSISISQYQNMPVFSQLTASGSTHHQIISTSTASPATIRPSASE